MSVLATPTKAHVIRNLTQRRCQATKTTGHQCTLAAIDGELKCRYHTFGRKCKEGCRCFFCASVRIRSGK